MILELDSTEELEMVELQENIDSDLIIVGDAENGKKVFGMKALTI